MDERSGRLAREVTSQAALLAAILLVLYALVLSIGLLTLPSPDSPITDPWFTGMEVLILLLVPVLIALASGLHLSTPQEMRVFTLAGFGLMTAAGLITAVVHFSVLVLSRHPDFQSEPHILSFQWPSAVYVLDILAWDIFFALSVLFFAASLNGRGAARVARLCLVVAGGLSLVGLAGVPLNDMNIRNIGILGYVGAFIPACIAIHIAFKRRPD